MNPMKEIEQIPEAFDPTVAIAIGEQLADLQFEVAESSYQQRLSQNYDQFCVSQASDAAMSRYLGEYVALIRLDERLRFIGRMLLYGLMVAILPIGMAIALGWGSFSTLLLVPALLLGMWLAAVNH
jgi:hypothetical protein